MRGPGGLRRRGERRLRSRSWGRGLRRGGPFQAIGVFSMIYITFVGRIGGEKCLQGTILLACRCFQAYYAR